MRDYPPHYIAPVNRRSRPNYNKHSLASRLEFYPLSQIMHFSSVAELIFSRLRISIDQSATRPIIYLYPLNDLLRNESRNLFSLHSPAQLQSDPVPPHQGATWKAHSLTNCQTNVRLTRRLPLNRKPFELPVS